MNQSITVRQVNVSEVLDLRHRVLRPNEPKESVFYEADHRPGPVHFGAFLKDELVAICSAYQQAQEGEDSGRAYRLRGVATSATVRGQGVGSVLLREVLQYLQDSGASKVWCNARTRAVPFYSRLGFVVDGEEFDIPGIGPHLVCVLGWQ